ncbi:MAG: hypothetical protein K2N05_09130 [Muribaculaceae bacterium]|nr:hypothetical protein [Muribaculaceae bacterium]
MKSAATSMGGRNVAYVWSPCEFSCKREQRQARLTMPSVAENALREMEKGAKQTGIDGSEKQA